MESISNQYYTQDAPIDKKIVVLRYVAVIIFVLLLTLPFHYVAKPFTIIPKSSWGFSETFITNKDLDKVICKYNGSDGYQREKLLQQTWLKKMISNRIVYYTYKVEESPCASNN